MTEPPVGRFLVPSVVEAREPEFLEALLVPLELPGRRLIS